VTTTPEVPLPTTERHTARWVAIGVLVVMAGLVAVLATRPSAVQEAALNPVVGKMAPPISGETLSGTRYSLPRVPGKFVVVSFFASWCAQCQEEGPALVTFQFQHQKSGTATVLSIMFSDSQSSARASQALLGVKWPTMVDAGGTMALDFGVKELPSTFLIAPDGHVVASFTAPVTAKGLNWWMAKAKAEHA
jgi:cytochrome c biogenesis protein CcmG, thiol:disulfide interchange protein DsbE